MGNFTSFFLQRNTVVWEKVNRIFIEILELEIIAVDIHLFIVRNVYYLMGGKQIFI